MQIRQVPPTLVLLILLPLMAMAAGACGPTPLFVSEPLGPLEPAPTDQPAAALPPGPTRARGEVLLPLVVALPGPRPTIAPARSPTLGPATAPLTALPAVRAALPERPAQPPVDRDRRHPQPAPASIIVNGQEQASALGGFCWQEPGMKDTELSLCDDTAAIASPADALAAPAFLAVTLRLPGEAPVAAQMEILRVKDIEPLAVTPDGVAWWPPMQGSVLGLRPAAEQAFQVLLEPGRYILSVDVRWSGQREVQYGFLVEVK